MRTISIYSFEELSKEAQEVAVTNYLNNLDSFAWDYENKDTIQTIADRCNWIAHWDSYDGVEYTVWFEINSEEDIGNLSGKRAMAYIENNYITPNEKPKTYWLNHVLYCDGRKNWKRYSKIFRTLDDCPFTGYCLDEAFNDAWEEWKNKFSNSSTVEDFVCFVGNKLGSYWSQDNEYQMTKEYIADFFEANEYEFTETGKRWRG